MRVHSSGTTTSDLVQVCIGTSLLPGYHTNLLEISDTARKLILAIIVAFVIIGNAAYFISRRTRPEQRS